MKDKLLSIGEVAKLKGVGIKSLRYYESIGIFNPAYTNPQTGYRYYSMTQMMELDVIITCIELGIPLKELESYRMPSGALDLVALLERGRSLARQRMREAQTILLQTETYLNEIREQRQLQSGPHEAKSRHRTESLALATPLAGPEGLGIRAYVHAIARLYYFDLGNELVPLYKQGIMRNPRLGDDWEVYIEMQMLDGSDADAVRHHVEDAIAGTGIRLASIPAGTYGRTLVEGNGYETTFVRAREMAAHRSGLILVSDMWKAEVDLNSSSFELLALQDEDEPAR